VNDRTPAGDAADRDIVAVLDAAALHPTDDFRARLGEQLAIEAEGDRLVLLDAAPPTPRRRWPMALAAAGLLAVVVGIAVVARPGDGDERVPVSVPESTEGLEDMLDPDALVNEELAAELDGRRWVALERFDTADGSAFVPTVAFISGAGFVDGHDGCVPYGGGLVFDDATVSTTTFERDVGECDLDRPLAIEAGQQVELLADADEFLLRADDGTPLARFTDQSALEPADPELLTFSWFADAVGFVTFTDTGRASFRCTLFGWAVEGDVVSLRLDDRQPECSAVGDSPMPHDAEARLAEMAADTALIYERGPEPLDGLVVLGESGAVLLRTLPPVDVDPTRITVGAGALFGIEPGLGIDAEEVITAARPQVGEPTADTGWIAFDDRRFEENEFREVRWGDLVTIFLRRGSRSEFRAWNVGDDRVLASQLPPVERTEPGEPTGLRTEHGIAVGDPLDDVPSEFNLAIVDNDGNPDPWFDADDRVQYVVVRSPNPRATAGSILPSTRGGGYIAVDGTIVAIGANTGP